MSIWTIQSNEGFGGFSFGFGFELEFHFEPSRFETDVGRARCAAAIAISMFSDCQKASIDSKGGRVRRMKSVRRGRSLKPRQA